jgi:RimJ/RimL family protein N-acetyltransferase
MLGILPNMAGEEFQIPIINDEGGLIGYYVSFSEKILDNSVLLLKFAQWRNDNLKYFLVQDKSTLESTFLYVRETIDDTNKNMFLMFDATGRVVGHFGFKEINSEVVELDNLLRTNEKIDADFILWAEKAMIRYIFNERKFRKVQLRMLASNVLARRLHESIGFQLSGSIPLMKVVTNKGGTHLLPCDSTRAPEGHLLEFILENYWVIPSD